MLFRWFLDMEPDAEVVDHAVFTHNRKRLEELGLTGRFFDGVVRQAQEAGLTSDEHVSVDGTLIQSHASLKSLKRIDGSSRAGTATARRAEATTRRWISVESGARTRRTDGALDAQGRDSGRLPEPLGGCDLGEPARTGGGGERRGDQWACGARERAADAWANSPAARDRAEDARDGPPPRRGRLPDGAGAVRPGRIVPKDDGSLAQMRARMRRILPSYRVSQRRRKMIEEVFGWVKTVGLLRRVRHLGRKRIAQVTEITMAAYKLVRMTRLLAT